MNVHAIIVGIEHYDALKDGITIELDGPASDAVRFATWLLERGAPPANLHVFLSPLDRDARLEELRRAPGGRQVADAVQPASREAIENLFNNDLPSLIADTLYVLWGGHGVMRAGLEHHLLYQDFRKNSPLTFGLEVRQAQLRTFAKLSKQHIFVDACANYVELSQFGNELDSSKPKVGSPDPLVTQHLLMAAASGQKAKNDTSERTGFFSRELLGLLNQSAPGEWPSAEDLAPQMESIFLEKGRNDRAFRQSPVLLSFRDNKGKGFELGTEPKPLGLQQLAELAGCTISQLDGLTSLSVSKILEDPAKRDSLYLSIAGRPVDRPWRNDADFDRKGLAALTLGEDKVKELIQSLKDNADLARGSIKLELERVSLACKAVKLLDDIGLSTKEYLAAFRRIPDVRGKQDFIEDMVTSLARMDSIERSPLFHFLLDIASASDAATCAKIETWIKDQDVASAIYLADVRGELAKKRNYRALISVQVEAGPSETPKSIVGILLENGVSRRPKAQRDVADPKELLSKLEEVYSELLDDIDSNVFVELILPFSLLCHPMESTGINPGPRYKKVPLSQRFPFVLRWRDRIKHPGKFQAERWTRAAEHVRACQPSLHRFPADESDRFWNKMGEPKCGLLDLGAQSSDPDYPVLADVLIEGAAFACWLRTALNPIAPSYRQSLAHLVAGGTFTDLPTRAVEPRGGPDLQSLALFWDDPESNPRQYVLAFEEPK